MDLTCQEKIDMQKLEDRIKELEQAWNDLLKEKREVDARVHMLEQQEKQFSLKWDLLIKETEKLATDKKEFEQARRKAFFEQCAAFADEDNSAYENENVIHPEMFFSGVSDAKSLKKRYKELIKIYHPDAESGDNEIVLEINREYDNMKQMMN